MHACALAKELGIKKVVIPSLSGVFSAWGMLLTDLLTSPTVVGKPGRDKMKNYGFVLRMLGKTPEWAADRLVDILRSNRSEFIEWRGFKPWTPFAGLLRIAWENLTRTGMSPRFRFKVMAPYRPRM